MGRLPRIERREAPCEEMVFCVSQGCINAKSPKFVSGTSLENLGARGAVASGLATAGLAVWQVIVPVRVPFLIRGS